MRLQHESSHVAARPKARAADFEAIDWRARYER